MPGPASPPRPRPNPFFVLQLLASTAFAITAWVGYVGPMMAKAPAQQAAPGAEPNALADWFNRRGTTALTVEFALMFASALLAMATDKWFSARTPPGPKAP